MSNKTIITTKREKKNDFYEILDKINHLEDKLIHLKDGNHSNGFLGLGTIESVRNGVNFKNFKAVYDLMELSNHKWAAIIGISERTMQHILKEKKNLDQNKSEKLMAFLSLVGYALDVLGDRNNLIEWLNYKSPIFNGKTPLDYVDTFQGINMLQEQIYKVETGNLV